MEEASETLLATAGASWMLESILWLPASPGAIWTLDGPFLARYARSVKPTITVDTRQWQAAARKLFQTSSRTCVDFTNGQALKVAVESVRQTEKANAAAIAHKLGEIGRQVSFKTISRGKNKGKIRLTKGMSITTDYVGRESFAARILGARFKQTGSFGVSGSTMEERIHNLIAMAKRSASFIASGWIGARNQLWSIVKKKPARMASLQGARQYGRPKGAARAAVFWLRSKITAEIVNTALMAHQGKTPTPGGDPMPVAQKGLQMALNVAAQDMTAELARRLDPDFKAVSKR